MMKFEVLKKRTQGNPANQRAQAEKCLMVAVEHIAGLKDITPEKAFDEIVEIAMNPNASKEVIEAVDDPEDNRNEIIDGITRAIIAEDKHLTKDGKTEVSAYEEYGYFDTAEKISADERDASFERVSAED